MKIGALYLGSNKCHFNVWAPHANDIRVKTYFPEEKIIPLAKAGNGYWSGQFYNISPGTRYKYIINNRAEYPDPASNFQPLDVHGPSEIVDHQSFAWTDKGWKAIPLEDYIIYELHIGAFTPEGTFASAINKIPHLKELGITAVEIMPVAQFPGNRNWGYDGVYPFAPHHSYGGPAGLKQLVNELHKNDIAAVLDVVYNHLGPEGNYINQFAPYFTSRYHTTWGDAVNFDDNLNAGVRNYFIQNALYWLREYNFDALRLDAIDKIYDSSPKHFLKELAENVKAFSDEAGVKKILIAESDLNDEIIIRPIDEGGYGLDAQWSDDFHHSLHAIVTGEKEGYYIDFNSVADLAKSIGNNFVYDGAYSVFRNKIHGNSAILRDKKQFVVCIQNHDQVGNRAEGERISSLISFELYKTVSAIVLLSPFVPLIFMGQELYESSPFYYFISHFDSELVQAVRSGRKEEFLSFNWTENIPDPFSEEIFMKSKIRWKLLADEKNAAVFSMYKRLIDIRKKNDQFGIVKNDNLEVAHSEEQKFIRVRFHGTGKEVFYIANLGSGTIELREGVPPGRWKNIFDSSSSQWLGPVVSENTNRLIGGEKIVLYRESFLLFESEI